MTYTKIKLTPEIKNKLKQFMPTNDTIKLGHYGLDFSHTYNIKKFTPNSILAEKDGKKYLIKVEKWQEPGRETLYVVFADGRKFQEHFK